MERKRDSFIDILKAIGIISIVMGHSSWVFPVGKFPIGPFVYTYHIMIFFFVAGWCFQWHSDFEPYVYIGKRIKGIYPYMIGYSIIFVLLHDLFCFLHILSQDTPVYTLQQMLYNILCSFAMVNSESLLGAFWFLPVLLFATSFFAVLFWQVEKKNMRCIGHCFFCIVAGGLGIYLNQADLQLSYHMQTAILAVPIVYLGYCAKCNWKKINRFVTWWGTILSAVLLTGLLKADIGMIELSVNSIISPWLFYPVTLTGIYFCLGLGKILNSYQRTRKLFQYIGRNSFHIMALHFLMFKLVDLGIGIYTHASYEVLETAPHAFSCWPLYYAAGIFGPLLVVKGKEICQVNRVFSHSNKK